MGMATARAQHLGYLTPWAKEFMLLVCLELSLLLLELLGFVQLWAWGAPLYSPTWPIVRRCLPWWMVLNVYFEQGTQGRPSLPTEDTTGTSVQKGEPTQRVLERWTEKCLGTTLMFILETLPFGCPSCPDTLQGSMLLTILLQIQVASWGVTSWLTDFLNTRSLHHPPNPALLYVLHWDSIKNPCWVYLLIVLFPPPDWRHPESKSLVVIWCSGS